VWEGTKKAPARKKNEKNFAREAGSKQAGRRPEPGETLKENQFTLQMNQRGEENSYVTKKKNTNRA